MSADEFDTYLAAQLDDRFIARVDRERRLVWTVSAADFAASRYDRVSGPVAFDDIEGTAPLFRMRRP